MNEQTSKVVQTPKSYAADGKTELHTLHGVGLVVSAVAFNKLYTTPPARPVQEPVAWIFKLNRELLWPDEVERENPIELNKYEPLYATAPAQPAPAPGYCKHCKQYTIDEPMSAQPAVQQEGD